MNTNTSTRNARLASFLEGVAKKFKASKLDHSSSLGPCSCIRRAPAATALPLSILRLYEGSIKAIRAVLRRTCIEISRQARAFY